MKFKSLAIVLLAFLAGSFSGFFLSSSISSRWSEKESPSQTPPPATATTPFSQEILKDYSLAAVAKAKTFTDGKQEEFLLVGYQSRNPMSGENKPYLEIFKITTNGLDSVYQYSPDLPSDLDYPTPLSPESIWVANASGENEKGPSLLIATAWGETGADYFGTHPIVIAYQNGSFKSLPLYQESLFEKHNLGQFDLNQKDFTVKNNFKPYGQAETILAQTMKVEDETISLSFYGDNECHACEHVYITVDLPLKKLFE